MVDIAWGRRVSPDFKAKVIAICGRLGCDASHLMSAMAFETGERLTSSVRNKASRATGLIQFMPKTAVGLGTTIDELAAMSEIDQLDVVEEYFRPMRGRMVTLS